MQIEKYITLRLDSAEYESLKKLLGGLSHADKTKFGLTDEQCTITSKIYDVLPNLDGEDA
jgi:hypothetical protein